MPAITRAAAKALTTTSNTKTDTIEPKTTAKADDTAQQPSNGFDQIQVVPVGEISRIKSVPSNIRIRGRAFDKALRSRQLLRFLRSEHISNKNETYCWIQNQPLGFYLLEAVGECSEEEQDEDKWPPSWEQLGRFKAWVNTNGEKILQKDKIPEAVVKRAELLRKLDLRRKSLKAKVRTEAQEKVKVSAPVPVPGPAPGPAHAQNDDNRAEEVPAGEKPLTSDGVRPDPEGPIKAIKNVINARLPNVADRLPGLFSLGTDWDKCISTPSQELQRQMGGSNMHMHMTDALPGGICEHATGQDVVAGERAKEEKRTRHPPREWYEWYKRYRLEQHRWGLGK